MALTTEDELQGRAEYIDIGVLLHLILYQEEERFQVKSHRLVFR